MRHKVFFQADEAICFKPVNEGINFTISFCSSLKTTVESGENKAVLKKILAKKNGNWSSNWQSKQNWQTCHMTQDLAAWSAFFRAFFFGEELPDSSAHRSLLFLPFHLSFTNPDLRRTQGRPTLSLGVSTSGLRAIQDLLVQTVLHDGRDHR